MTDGEGATAQAKELASKLQRYAGWLDKDRASAAVRADVDALAVAIDTGADTLPYLEALDRGIVRLVGGGVRKMIVGVLREMHTTLDRNAV